MGKRNRNKKEAAGWVLMVVGAILVASALMSVIALGSLWVVGDGEGTDAERKAGVYFESPLQQSTTPKPQQQQTEEEPMFVHIYSPFASLEAPLVSFALQHASEYAKKQGISVEFIAASTKADLSAAEKTGGIVKGSKKVSLSKTFGSWFPSSKRPFLPLISEVLNASLLSHARFVVLTNSDIIPRSDFYLRILEMLDKRPPKLKSLTINRKTIPLPVTDTNKLKTSAASSIQKSVLESLLLKVSSEPGRSHPGHDCFVFPRSWINTAVKAMDGFVAGAPIWGCWFRNLVCSGVLSSSTSLVNTLLIQNGTLLNIDGNALENEGHYLSCTQENEHITMHINDDTKWRDDELPWIWNAMWMQISADRGFVGFPSNSKTQSIVKHCRSKNPCKDRSKSLLSESPTFISFASLLDQSCSSFH